MTCRWADVLCSVAKKNFREAIEDATNYRELSKLQRDIDILELIDGLPSLDPFLVREHLDCGGIKPDPSYFVQCRPEANGGLFLGRGAEVDPLGRW
jgi:hypothetical protein